MLDMVDGGRGEPGIFNRQAAINMRPARREFAEFGTNPCGEIILRPFQFCNLSIAIARESDTYETLKDKVEVAAIIGTIQSMATTFPGLRPIWQQNCREERLLGVDITGQMDSLVAQDPAVQNRLRQVVIQTNREYASLLGINESVATTCVKPSGNSSQLFDCASGLHARWSPYYIRNVRVGTSSPVYKVMRDAGVPMDPENGQSVETANTWVAHFPVKTPNHAVTRSNRGAIAQCEYWLQNKLHWTEHNPSVTITYHPDEVIDLIKWVWLHKDLIGGMAFLPSFDASYAQMPYQEITKEEYEILAGKFPNIDFSKLYRYEDEDYTKAAQELACVAGACEIEVVPTGNNGDTIEAVGLN
jgi:ribonucleoside-diphosphate reductase alpha chain